MGLSSNISSLEWNGCRRWFHWCGDTSLKEKNPKKSCFWHGQSLHQIRKNITKSDFRKLNLISCWYNFRKCLAFLCEKARPEKKSSPHVSNQSVYLSLLKMGRYFRALLLCKFFLIFHGFFKPEKSDTFWKKTFFWKL